MPPSEATRALLSIRAKERWTAGLCKLPSNKGRVSWNKGVPWSTQVRAKMSEARRGKAPKISEEARLRGVRTRKERGWWARDR